MAPNFNRRDFLTYSGAVVAGVTLGETGRRWLARADARAAAPLHAGVETIAASVCRECPAGCGIQARLIDGTPVKLDGNPNCPIARGRLCAKGQASLESYFDPDRLVGPARRAGRRGENTWQPIAWADAVALLAARLGAAREGAVVALGADERGPIDAAWSTFWTALHGRVAWTIGSTAERLVPAFNALTGAGGIPVFDLERATYVLSFGSPIVEDWLSPLWAQRSYGQFRRGGSRARGRLVHVDARRSLTARKADEWIPIVAERQVFLAYGIASVLLREDRVDRSMLADVGGNVAEFERTVTARYTPDAVALATGVPVVTLLRLARELTSTAHPLVTVSADASADLVDAVLALNAIIGAIDSPGGVGSVPAAAARDDRSAAAALADIASRRAAPDVLALRDASPFRALAAPHDLTAELERCGFIVSFSPYLDEAAANADLLLPTHTPLESWHGLVPPTADATEKFACARPAVAPRLDTRDLVGILRATGDALGERMPAPLPATSAEAVGADIDRLWERRRGVPYANEFQTTWVLQLERGGWWVPPAGSRDAFAAQVLDAGGWVDPYVASGQLRQAIVRRGGLTFVPPASRVADVMPAVAAPEERAPHAGAAASNTLRLIPFTPASVNVAGGPNQPVLFELLGQPDGSPWRVWAELHPETAARLGVAAGATIRVSTSAASIDVVAMLVDRTPANTIAVAFVPELANGGRWACRVTADVRRLWERGAVVGEPIDVRVAAV